MKNFEVSRLENSSYDYLVIATTYISPISTLDEVQKAFKNISGKKHAEIVENGTISKALKNLLISGENI